MPPSHATLHAHALDFWLARGAIALVAVLNLLLVNDLTLGPPWLAPAFELAMLLPLSIATAWTQGKARHAHTDHHWHIVLRLRRQVRRAALLLTAVVTAINFHALYNVMGALLHGAKGSTGTSLLLDALNIWFTNVVVFALWFWNLDRGGPAMRGLAAGKPADFQFPQMQGSSEADRAWSPGFVDYFFLAFTNATAFSPTDTQPMTARAKLLMMLESAVSLLTVGLVAARAVNILA